MYFVEKNSIVRKIWGKSDTVLFIFAGASAEFALNRAVDWLYFTGRLPADPLGRLFSTVTYARKIVFNETEKAHAAIDKITAIHSEVEANRGAKIPAWAYRDVLYMLIHYSIASYELLEKKLTEDQKADVFDVFNRLGTRMGLEDLPSSYSQWLISRDKHMEEDLLKTDLSQDLYKQYRKHLGFVRYKLLMQSQVLVVPQLVRNLLGIKKAFWISPLISIYKVSRVFRLDGLLKSIILPAKYKNQIKEIDVEP